MQKIMKELLKDYTKYNIWANERICRILESLPDDILDKELKSSFNTIRKTVYHIWDAEAIWNKRLNGKSLKGWPSETFKGSFVEFKNDFLGGSGKLFMYVINKEPKQLEQNLTYKNIKGEAFVNKIEHIIQHVINHSTFHRGQIIAMLRIAGVTEVFPTDFITFARENK
jgi:uncharacterized damage-inducible protein DinB